MVFGFECTLNMTRTLTPPRAGAPVTRRSMLPRRRTHATQEAPQCFHLCESNALPRAPRINRWFFRPKYREWVDMVGGTPDVFWGVWVQPRHRASASAGAPRHRDSRCQQFSRVSRGPATPRQQVSTVFSRQPGPRDIWGLRVSRGAATSRHLTFSASGCQPGPRDIATSDFLRVRMSAATSRHRRGGVNPHTPQPRLAHQAPLRHGLASGWRRA